MSKQEPVELDKNDDKWYFWEENWALRHGPFDTKNQVYTALDKYCQEEFLSLPESYVIKETEGLE